MLITDFGKNEMSSQSASTPSSSNGEASATDGIMVSDNGVDFTVHREASGAGSVAPSHGFKVGDEVEMIYIGYPVIRGKVTRIDGGLIEVRDHVGRLGVDRIDNRSWHRTSKLKKVSTAGSSSATSATDGALEPAASVVAERFKFLQKQLEAKLKKLSLPTHDVPAAGVDGIDADFVGCVKAQWEALDYPRYEFSKKLTSEVAEKVSACFGALSEDMLTAIELVRQYNVSFHRVLSDEFAGAEKKKSDNDAVKQRRKHFDSFSKRFCAGEYPKNRSAMHLMLAEIGDRTELETMLRDVCVTFKNAAMTMVYLKMRGIVPLSVRTYAPHHFMSLEHQRQWWKAGAESLDERMWKSVLSFLCEPATVDPFVTVTGKLLPVGNNLRDTSVIHCYLRSRFSSGFETSATDWTVMCNDCPCTIRAIFSADSSTRSVTITIKEAISYRDSVELIYSGNVVLENKPVAVRRRVWCYAVPWGYDFRSPRIRTRLEPFPCTATELMAKMSLVPPSIDSETDGNADGEALRLKWSHLRDKHSLNASNYVRIVSAMSSAERREFSDFSADVDALKAVSELFFDCRRLASDLEYKHLMLFEHGKHMFCYDARNDQTLKIRQPTQSRADDECAVHKLQCIPRSFNAGFPERLYENKEVTVTSFFHQGKECIQQSMQRVSPFPMMRKLVYFFIFASQRLSRFVDANSKFVTIANRFVFDATFLTIAKRFIDKPHALYWVVLNHLSHDMLKRSSTVFAQHMNARVEDNAKKAKDLDMSAECFGNQVAHSGRFLFVVRFRVRNHPAGKNWIQYGSLLDNNDYSVTTGLTGADLLRYWMFRFWNSPIAYVFDHDVPRPDSSGLPPFTLLARWSICKDSKCDRRFMSLHKHTVRFLTKVVQNTEVNIGKLFAKYKKTEKPIEARLTILHGSKNSTTSLPYDTKLRAFLALRFPHVAENDLSFSFPEPEGGARFELTHDSTVADLVEFCNIECRLNTLARLWVPVQTLLQISNYNEYDRWSGRWKNYEVPYSRKAREWLLSEFMWLEYHGVVDRIQLPAGVALTATTTVGDIVAHGRSSEAFVRIRLPHIKRVVVRNAVPFKQDYYNYSGNNGMRFCYKQGMKEVVGEIAKLYNLNPAEVLLHQNVDDSVAETLGEYESEHFDEADEIEIRWPLRRQRLVERIMATLDERKNVVMEQAYLAAMSLQKFVKMSFLRVRVKQNRRLFYRDYIFVDDLRHRELIEMFYAFLFHARYTGCGLLFPSLAPEAEMKDQVICTEAEAYKKKAFAAYYDPDASSKEKVDGRASVRSLMQFAEKDEQMHRFLYSCHRRQIYSASSGRNDNLRSAFEEMLSGLNGRRQDYEMNRLENTLGLRIGFDAIDAHSHGRFSQRNQLVVRTLQCFEDFPVPVFDLAKGTYEPFFLSFLKKRGSSTYVSAASEDEGLRFVLSAPNLKSNLFDPSTLGDTPYDKEVKENLKGIETKDCAICFDTFMQPVITPCRHVFCLKCLKRAFRSGESGECPMCKRDVSLSEVKSLTHGDPNCFRQMHELWKTAPSNFEGRDLCFDNVTKKVRQLYRENTVDDLTALSKDMKWGFEYLTKKTGKRDGKWRPAGSFHSVCEYLRAKQRLGLELTVSQTLKPKVWMKRAVQRLKTKKSACLTLQSFWRAHVVRRRMNTETRETIQRIRRNLRTLRKQTKKQTKKRKRDSDAAAKRKAEDVKILRMLVAEGIGDKEKHLARIQELLK